MCTHERHVTLPHPPHVAIPSSLSDFALHVIHTRRASMYFSITAHKTLDQCADKSMVRTTANWCLFLCSWMGVANVLQYFRLDLTARRAEFLLVAHFVFCGRWTRCGGHYQTCKMWLTSWRRRIHIEFIRNQYLWTFWLFFLGFWFAKKKKSKIKINLNHFYLFIFRKGSTWTPKLKSKKKKCCQWTEKQNKKSQSLFC